MVNDHLSDALPDSSSRFQTNTNLIPPAAAEQVATAVVPEQPVADRLPTELLEILFKSIDLGTFSNDTVSAVLAVSRRWRAVAVPHLFRAIRIHFHADSQLTEEQAALVPVTNSRNGKRKRRFVPQQPQRTLPTIYQFFTQNPQYAAYVRELQLVLVCPKMRAQGGFARTVPPTVDTRDLLEVLHLFQRLEYLKLYDITVRTTVEDALSASRSLIPVNVGKVRVQFPERSQDRTGVAHFLAVFALFGVVNEFWIGPFGWNVVNRGVVIPQETQLHVRFLHIEPVAAFLYPILSTIFARSRALRHVELNFYNDLSCQNMDYSTDSANANVLSITVNFSQNCISGWMEATAAFVKELVSFHRTELILAISSRHVPQLSPLDAPRDAAVRSTTTHILTCLHSHAGSLPPVSVFYIANAHTPKNNGISVRALELPATDDVQEWEGMNRIGCWLLTGWIPRGHVDGRHFFRNVTESIHLEALNSY